MHRLWRAPSRLLLALASAPERSWFSDTAMPWCVLHKSGLVTVSSWLAVGKCTYVCGSYVKWAPILTATLRPMNSASAKILWLSKHHGGRLWVLGKDARDRVWEKCGRFLEVALNCFQAPTCGHVTKTDGSLKWSMCKYLAVQLAHAFLGAPNPIQRLGSTGYSL